MSSMAVDNVNVFPPDPLIWMWLSAFKKASVILDNHTQHSVTSPNVTGCVGKRMQTVDFLTCSRWCCPPCAGRLFCGGSFSCGTCRTGCPLPGNTDYSLWERADLQNGLLCLIPAPCLLCKCTSPHPHHTLWRISGSACDQKCSGCLIGSSPWRQSGKSMWINTNHSHESEHRHGNFDPDLEK